MSATERVMNKHYVSSEDDVTENKYYLESVSGIESDPYFLCMF